MINSCATAASWPACVRVLIIDDDAEQRLAVKGILERAGYQVFEASNGKEGLHLCRTERPSIVLLDAIMPVMDGTAFLTRKAFDPEIAEIPVVMLTAWDVGGHSGVVSVLRKPVTGHAIGRAVRSFARLATPPYLDG